MLKYVNINFSINNNNKAKKIYNKGDIFIVRPQNMKFPYKIISIKEKKINLEERIKRLKMMNQKSSFTLSDICSISNLDIKTKMKKNISKEDNSRSKNSFLNSTFNNDNNTSKLNKNNSGKEIRKKMINLEMQKQMEDKNVIQRNYINNFFLKNKGLSNDRCTNKYSYDNIYQLRQKIKEENSKQIYFDSTMLSNEKNKNCYKLKYITPKSRIILNDVDEKNLIWKRNFDNINNNNSRSKIKEIKFNKTFKYFNRPKSSKMVKIKTSEKVINKMKRPFSTDNKNRCKKHNSEIKEYKRNIKIEENKNTKEKENKILNNKKKLKIQKTLKNKSFNGDIGNIKFKNEFKSKPFNNYTNLKRFKIFKSGKNSDIFDYIVLPNSEINTTCIKKEPNKDFTEYKSILDK